MPDNDRVTTSDPLLLAQRIHAVLPQTQCTRCGYPDCAAYAQAIATGSAAINQCPPGGAEGVQRLAAITGLPAPALNAAHGFEGPRNVFIIDEAWCIGCTLCMKVCPTDAIVGSNKVMHTIIEPYCTGCGLCVPVCPVDCISFENVSGKRTGWQAWSQNEADTALKRYKIHSIRSKQNKLEGFEKPLVSDVQANTDAEDKKRAVIQAVLARSRATRQTAV